MSQSFESFIKRKSTGFAQLFQQSEPQPSDWHTDISRALKLAIKHTTQTDVRGLASELLIRLGEQDECAGGLSVEVQLPADINLEHVKTWFALKWPAAGVKIENELLIVSTTDRGTPDFLHALINHRVTRCFNDCADYAAHQKRESEFDKVSCSASADVIKRSVDKLNAALARDRGRYHADEDEDELTQEEIEYNELLDVVKSMLSGSSSDPTFIAADWLDAWLECRRWR